MKLGFVSAIVPDLSLPEVLQLAADEGFSCVELMCWPRGKAERRYAGVTHIDVDELDESAAARILEQTAAAGVAISGLGYYPNLLTPDQAEARVCLEHLKQVIAAARLLGVGVVNTFIGRDWTRSVDDNWPRFLEIWRPLIQLAESHGVRIAIENCPMLFSRDEWPGGKNLAYCPAIWRRMFDDIPSSCFGLELRPLALDLAADRLHSAAGRVSRADLSCACQGRQDRTSPPGRRWHLGDAFGIPSAQAAWFGRRAVEPVLLGLDGYRLSGPRLRRGRGPCLRSRLGRPPPRLAAERELPAAVLWSAVTCHRFGFRFCLSLRKTTLRR